MKKQGLEDVVIREYDVYGTNPKSASLEMIAPVSYHATLREAPLEGDPDSKNQTSAAHGAACRPPEKRRPPWSTR